MAAAVVGAGVTAVATFLLTGAVRQTAALRDIASITVIGLSLALALSLMLGIGIPVVSRRWIIPRDWQAYGGRMIATLFGFNLGLGWRTHVATNGFWLLLGSAAIVGGQLHWVFAFVAFAIARAVPLYVLALRHMTGSSTSTLQHGRDMRHFARSMTVTCLEITATSALATALWLTQ